MRQKKPNEELEEVIVKTVAAFMNSGGGTLFIGVDDYGHAIGLEYDYHTLKKQDSDGFQNFLMTLFANAYGKDISSLLIRVDFYELDGEEVCQVGVDSAPKPVYAPDGAGGENLYVRAGNSTR